MSQVAQPAALSIRQVASALYGRPAIDPGGASEFDILEPLMQTDTKSYQDFAKIVRHLSGYSQPSTVVNVFTGDGQSCIGMKNLKRRWRLATAVCGLAGGPDVAARPRLATHH